MPAVTFEAGKLAIPCQPSEKVKGFPSLLEEKSELKVPFSTSSVTYALEVIVENNAKQFEKTKETIKHKIKNILFENVCDFFIAYLLNFEF